MYYSNISNIPMRHITQCIYKLEYAYVLLKVIQLDTYVDTVFDIPHFWYILYIYGNCSVVYQELSLINWL